MLEFQGLQLGLFVGFAFLLLLVVVGDDY